MKGRSRSTAIIVGIALVCSAWASHAADDTAKVVPPATSAESSPAATTRSPSRAPTSAVSGETGLAAVYNRRLNGHKTASGEPYDADRLTAAHKTLPLGTKVKVTNTRNHKSVIVRINDRGPKQPDRILDLSTAAAKQLGIGPNGMARVSTAVVGK